MFGSNTFVSGGTFNQVYQYNVAIQGPLERLQGAASPAAFHNSANRRDPPKCHPNTRVAILRNIMDWILGCDSKRRNAMIMWIYGPAGSGKSAIAQSIAEWCHEEGILVASYFFSRFDPTRNHSRSLIATIAYQASVYFPLIREDLSTAIDHDPLLFTRSLDSQIVTLLIQPLHRLQDIGYFHDLNSKCVIVMDGLDECEDRKDQVEILSAISKAITKHHLPFIFLIASRPQHEIATSFGLNHMSKISTRLSLDSEYFPSVDIRRFFLDKFDEIKQNHPSRNLIPLGWPEEHDIYELVEKSSGQFIYASTVVNFVQSTRHRPTNRLEVVLGTRSSLRDMPFAELDALYIYILCSLPDFKPVLQILAFCVLITKWNRREYVGDAEELLLLDGEDIRLLLCDLTSLLSVSVEEYTLPSRTSGTLVARIEFFHASFVDFLVDPSRSNQFYVDLPLQCARFASSTIRRLGHGCSMFPRSSCPLRPIFYALRWASPIPDLQAAILDVSFTKLVSPNPSVDDAYYFIEILNFVKQSEYEDAEQLYSHQKRCFFDYLEKKVMEKVYMDPAAIPLLSITRLLVQFPRPFGVRDWVPLFGIDESSPKYRLFIMLGFEQEIRYIGHPLLTLTLEFLENPTISGIYALTEDRYATAALYFLKFLSGDHAKHPLKSGGIDQRRRNSPWVWRRQKKIRQICKDIAHWGWRWNSQKSQYYDPHIYSKPTSYPIALGGVMHALPKSGRSKELICFIIWQTIGTSSWKRPRLTRPVRKEAAKYLRRVMQDTCTEPCLHSVVG